MKTIIILGESRSGKTTLANMIVKKFNYQVLHVDYLRDTFRDIFPELDIAPNSARKNRKFQLFLKEYINKNTHNKEKNSYGYVMEGCETTVKDCNELFNNENNIVYYLGQAKITANQLFDNIRKYDTPREWTYKIPDDELLEYAKSIVENSNKIKKECEKYNIIFIDTSKDRKKVLDEIIKELEMKI